MQQSERRSPSTSAGDPFPAARKSAPPRSFLDLLGEAVWRGTAESMSYRPRWLYPWFRLLRSCGLAVGRRGRDLPMSWQVTRDGEVFRFERRFGEGASQVLTEAFVPGPEARELTSRRGPFGCLEIRWRESEADAGGLRLECSGVAWRFGRVRFPIPGWAWPEVRQHLWLREGGQVVDVAWDVDDSLIGRIFTYEGSLRRDPAPDQFVASSST